ncbi:SDR family oxidoreductase [Curtobacterium sp. MCBD17_035]|uniref:SDR family oxidoreductase n=1 Tax=Curtobacterium sp. MCBD17_035 TaxID=2175673 RepID=UPI000DA7EA7A|nr:SDR family oxidoreductase [Curtobacterium sp. MCBD17_035]WIB67914.1 SDR family oxidoreductase [Curtobacterium sp. MCBD17_035]
MGKVWFITGTSRGLGREFALAALGRGDRVAATARDAATLDDVVAAYGDAVLPLTLDVTDRAQVDDAVRRAHERFGRLDVVVNNAGYGHFGFVEELTDAELQDQLDTNLFGVLHVTQAVLPILRAQGSGHIVQISTIGGIAAFPMIGAYHASKWALEGLTEALAQEVRGFGVDVTLVEPGGFSTDWAGSSARHSAPLPAYDGLREQVLAGRTAASAGRGDPTATGAALLRIVDADDKPLRVLFGEQPTHLVKTLYADRLRTWVEWEPVSLAAQGGTHAGEPAAG